MRVSVVIPTRNRSDSLRRALTSLLSQHKLPDEIIVVDSSDDGGNVSLQDEFSASVRWIRSPASVCLQRNRGIREASGHWILLCDDDIELPPNYLATLSDYVASHPECGAAAGRLLQRESEGWVDQYAVRSFADLLWRFVFQLPVWGSIERFRVPSLVHPVYGLIRRFYRKRHNTLSLAGWPLITQWDDLVFQTTTYSLGANLVRKDWLISAPYDETLDPSGIGDNYGVALGFPAKQAIHVLGSTSARHHRVKQNRLSRPLTYYRRSLALHYFLLKKKSGIRVKLWFTWSLMGNALMFIFKGDYEMVKATTKVISVVVTSRNPYWDAYLRKEKNVSPQLTHP